MSARPPRNRRKFSGEWDEILYLYDKILYWWYNRTSRRRALQFCNKVVPLLKLHARNHTAIKGEECWSLVFEVRRNLQKAIRHRENEIRLIERLRRLKQAMEDYQPRDLADRLDLLAILYHDAGDTEKAIKCLVRSKRVCARAAIPFDGRTMLAEYSANLRKVRKRVTQKGVSSHF
jgi:tetratricopeptide (TPR) repeat protein